MALPLILANILGGVGQGLAGAGEAVAQARKDARAEAAQKSLEQHQRRMEEIGAERGTVSPETLAALFGQIGLPVPSNLASLGRIPEGFARGAMERAAAQMERDRVEARQAAASQQAKAAFDRYRESGTPDTETMAFQSPEEGSGMTPQTVPGRPRDGMALLGELLGIPNLSQQHVTMAQDVLKPQAPHMVSDTTAYVYDQGRFVPVPGAGSTPPPPPPEPGTTRTTNIDWRGRRSFSDKPIEDRNDFDRAAMNVTNNAKQRYEELTTEERKLANEWVNSRPWRNRAVTEVNMRDLPLTPKQSEGFIHPRTLAGPPAGLTMNQAIQQGYIEADEKDRAVLADLQQTKQLVGALAGMSSRLITATNPVEAAAQYAQLKAGAVTGANATARVYEQTKASFLGTVSRALAGERGVLTNQDIARIEAAFPGFFDTKQAAAAKVALLNALIDTAAQARVAKMTKQPMDDAVIRTNIDAILDKLERVGGAVKLGGEAGVGNTTAPQTQGGWGKARQVR
jgi:hypothetical protein